MAQAPQAARVPPEQQEPMEQLALGREAPLLRPDQRLRRPGRRVVGQRPLRRAQPRPAARPQRQGQRQPAGVAPSTGSSSSAGSSSPTGTGSTGPSASGQQAPTQEGPAPSSSTGGRHAPPAGAAAGAVREGAAVEAGPRGQPGLVAARARGPPAAGVPCVSLRAPDRAAVAPLLPTGAPQVGPGKRPPGGNGRYPPEHSHRPSQCPLPETGVLWHCGQRQVQVPCLLRPGSRLGRPSEIRWTQLQLCTAQDQPVPGRFSPRVRLSRQKYPGSLPAGGIGSRSSSVYFSTPGTDQQPDALHPAGALRRLPDRKCAGTLEGFPCHDIPSEMTMRKVQSGLAGPGNWESAGR